MLNCYCPDTILTQINKKLICIGDDLLMSKKYGMKRKYTYDDFFIWYQYKQIIESTCCIDNENFLEKLKTKL